MKKRAAKTHRAMAEELLNDAADTLARSTEKGATDAITGVGFALLAILDEMRQSRKGKHDAIAAPDDD